MDPRGWPARRGVAAVVLTAGLAAAAAGHSATDATPITGGPSVLLPFRDGASAYSGVGRYEGRATCTAFFLDTGPVPIVQQFDAPAYAVTNGHCPAFPGPNEVLVDQPGVGRVIFNFFVDSERRQVPVQVARVAYATMKGSDVAVLELTARYMDLAVQLIRPLRVASSNRTVPGDPITIVGAPLWPDLGEAFLRAVSCRTEGVASALLEGTWHWFDAPFNHCRDTLPGSSGSPVISAADRLVIGMVNTSTRGSGAITECAIDSPCELGEAGPLTRPDTTYVASLIGIAACFDADRRFSVAEPGCPLDPGNEPVPEPQHIGPVNPRLATLPLGPGRRAWDVTVPSTSAAFRFAVVTRSPDECRARSVYSTPVSPVRTPSIDVPLPLTEGFAFLCIVDAASIGDGWLREPTPTVIVARTDLTPPRMKAQARITESDEAWFVRFRTVAEEVAFHAYKVGPPSETRCSDGSGYKMVLDALTALPKATRPYRLCVIPYDAAQNAGVLFEQVLQ
jgi:hypothetical protein